MYKKEDFEINVNHNCKCGWYITLPLPSEDKEEYLHKDLQFHTGTGFITAPEFLQQWGMAPGYYPAKNIAEQYLDLFLEKQKMDDIEIIVKANGKVVPLDTISTETFEKMKKATVEPKYEGVYTARTKHLQTARVMFVVTEQICEHIGHAVALDGYGVLTNADDTLDYMLAYVFEGGETIYDNIKRLGD